MRCVKIFNKYFAANTVVTYLRCGGIVNNQIKSGLLQSLTVKFFFKSVYIWHSYMQKGGLCRALSSIF